jgi:hypothetical protein
MVTIFYEMSRNNSQLWEAISFLLEEFVALWLLIEGNFVTIARELLLWRG